MSEAVIGNAFQGMVFTKALALFQAGEKRGIIDEDQLGPLEIFLEERPEVLFLTLIYPNDNSELSGKTIYLGGDQ